MDPSARIEQRLRNEHQPVLSTIVDAADATAAGFETQHAGQPATTHGDRITEPLRQLLTRTGALAACPAVLADLVAATGESLPAPPVAAPPYVVVASSGPILRATLPQGRLVVLVRVFEAQHTADGVRYVRTDHPPGEPPIRVEFR